MNDDSSHRPSLLERLTSWLSREPEDREALLELLHAAHERNLLDAEALSMIEGVMRVSEMQVREIMVPRAQMDVVDLDTDPADLLPYVIDTAHSRFPVVEGDRDNVRGILLAKDLLPLCAGQPVVLADLLRPAVFVPEAKRLNVLLREFRASRNHMAIVVDEYGGVAGLVTIEDVLEQIVGEIEDEYDEDDDAEDIVAEAEGVWRVRAQADLDHLRAAVDRPLAAEDIDTVAGLVLHALGRMPHTGEKVDIDGLRFQVLRADGRRLLALRVARLAEPAAEGEA